MRTSRDHNELGHSPMRGAVLLVLHLRDPGFFKSEMGHRGFTAHVHAQLLGGPVMGIHQRLATAQKKGIRPRKR